MWRPLEVFLYDWWPIRAEARLCDRLSEMPVRIVYKADASSDAWREDWPAVPAVGQSSTRTPGVRRPGQRRDPSRARAADLMTQTVATVPPRKRR